MSSALTTEFPDTKIINARKSVRHLDVIIWRPLFASLYENCTPPPLNHLLHIEVLEGLQASGKVWPR